MTGHAVEVSLADRRAIRSLATPTWNVARLLDLVRRQRGGEMQKSIAIVFGCRRSQIVLWLSRLRQAGVALPRLKRQPAAPHCRKQPPEPARATAAYRKCLRCDDQFKSWGFGNRICQFCRVANGREMQLEGASS